MTDLSIKAILVDDEPRGLNALLKLLAENCPEVDVLATCTNCRTAKTEIDRHKPQLLFLDVSMPGLNGFDLLDEIDYQAMGIIFVTAHSNYAINAFKYSAIDYLLKPVDEELLVDAVSKMSRKLKLQSGHYADGQPSGPSRILPPETKLCIPSLKGFTIVDFARVLYCEASGSYTTIHLVDNNHIVSSKPIIDYELLLQNNGFFRVHKSFLVNLMHIKEYIKGEGGSIMLSNNRYLEVSRRRKDSFMGRIKHLFKY